VNGAFPQTFALRNDIPTAQGTEVQGLNFFLPRAVEISFLHTKGCGNSIPVRNEI
jgi:hypothetical protein